MSVMSLTASLPTLAVRSRATVRRGNTAAAASSSSSSNIKISTTSSCSAVVVGGFATSGVSVGVGRDRRARRGTAAVTPNALPVDAPTPAPIADVAAGLEGGIQAIYLGSLLAILGFAGFIIIRQVFIRRELDESAKQMGERIRSGEATAEEYFEMGSIMLRKKVYTQAVRNLKLAAQMWEGDQEDLAQIHNALGFGYLSTDKLDEAVVEFNKAVELQPGYVTAWNNLGDALEQKKDPKGAIAAYEESLVLSPGNQVAENRLVEIKRRLTRLNQM